MAQFIEQIQQIDFESPYHGPGTVVGPNLDLGKISIEQDKQTALSSGAYPWGDESPHPSLLSEIHSGMRDTGTFSQSLPVFGFAKRVKGWISQKGLQGLLLPTHKCFVSVTLGETKNKRLTPC